MGLLLDLFDSLKAAIRTRLRLKAQEDLAKGAEILAQAQKEAQEMEQAAKTVPDSKPAGNSNG